jgi:hypothetical protein
VIGCEVDLIDFFSKYRHSPLPAAITTNHIRKIEKVKIRKAPSIVLRGLKVEGFLMG